MPRFELTAERAYWLGISGGILVLLALALVSKEYFNTIQPRLDQPLTARDALHQTVILALFLWLKDIRRGA